MVHSYTFQKTDIEGMIIIEPFYNKDNRGGMIKGYSEIVFREKGISFIPKETLFIESAKGVLRGLHFQRKKPQAKLIRCIEGSIYCVVVDIRVKSATVGKWSSVELNKENISEVYIPVGCAVGTLALQDSLFVCQCSENFIEKYDDGIVWNDSDLNIEWAINELREPIISDKDRGLQSFRHYIEKANNNKDK